MGAPRVVVLADGAPAAAAAEAGATATLIARLPDGERRALEAAGVDCGWCRPGTAGELAPEDLDAAEQMISMAAAIVLPTSLSPDARRHALALAGYHSSTVVCHHLPAHGHTFEPARSMRVLVIDVTAERDAAFTADAAAVARDWHEPGRAVAVTMPDGVWLTTADFDDRLDGPVPNGAAWCGRLAVGLARGESVEDAAQGAMG